MNEVYEINGVRVHGRIDGPKQVVVLTLDIDNGDEYPEKISFILNNWGASAILGSLVSAGVKSDTKDEEKPEPVEQAPPRGGHAVSPYDKGNAWAGVPHVPKDDNGGFYTPPPTKARPWYGIINDPVTGEPKRVILESSSGTSSLADQMENAETQQEYLGQNQYAGVDDDIQMGTTLKHGK